MIASDAFFWGYIAGIWTGALFMAALLGLIMWSQRS